MTTTDETAIVRLTGRRGLLAAVPALLGFHPQESLVMVCLSGPRRRVGPVIRIDLADLDEGGRTDTGHPGTRLPNARAAGDAGRGGDPSAAMAQMVLHARRYAQEVALMCYTEQPGRPPMLDRFISILEDGGTCVLDSVGVRAGRAYSWGPGSGGDDDGSGAPVPGPADPQVEEITAASALNGRAVLADRQALHDSIAGPSGPGAARASAALHAAADGLLARIDSSSDFDRTRLAHMARRAVDAGLCQVDGTGSVEPPTAALITLLMSDVEIRDEVIARAVTDIEQPFVPLLIALARAIPDDDAAEICAMLSMAAYRRGDGALAQVAVDRTLRSEPAHRLAHLMLGVMSCGMPPADLEQLVSVVSPAGDG